MNKQPSSQATSQTDLQLKPKLPFKAEFAIRLILYIVASCVVPISVFAVKFGLFEKRGYTIVVDELGNVIDRSMPAFNGWGIVSCIILGVTAIKILKYVADSFIGYSLTKQVLIGVSRTLLPLGLGICTCYFLNNVMEHVIFCLVVIFIANAIAIPLNPFPKWRYLKFKQENYTEFSESFIKFIKTWKQSEGGGK